MRRMLVIVALCAAQRETADIAFVDTSYSFAVHQHPKIVRVQHIPFTGSSDSFYVSAPGGLSNAFHSVHFPNNSSFTDVDIDADYDWETASTKSGLWRLVTTQTLPHPAGYNYTADMSVVPEGPPRSLFVNNTSGDEGSTGPGNSNKPTVIGFTVRISSPSTYRFTVTPTFHDITATRNVDYTANDFPVTFEPGDIEKSLSISILPDNEPEGDEMLSVSISLSAPPEANISISQGSAIATIRDDDGAVGPPKLLLAHGQNGTISIRLGSPAPSPESILFTTSASGVASTQSLVTLPAGASSIDVPVTTGNLGSASIEVTLPASRGGRTYLVQVVVFEPSTLAFDRLSVILTPGATTNLIAHLDPLPPSPVAVTLTTVNPAIASVPSSITIGTDGNATIPIRGLVVGSTSVTATLPDLQGGTSFGFPIGVFLRTDLYVDSVDKVSGRAAGGDSVKIFGGNFTGRCLVTFDGVPSPNAQMLSTSSISATSPPHDAGVVDLAVKCGTSAATLHNAFTYTAAPLRITKVNPSNGSTNGGTLVRISGDNLRAGGCIASFGGKNAIAVALNDSFDLTVAAPAHAAGSVDVILRCGSDTFTSSAAFAYADSDDAPATIAFASVASAAPGDRITIGGARFRANDVVFIGNALANDISSDQPDTHSLTVPELAAGNASILLRDAFGRTVAGPAITIIPPRAYALTSVTSPVGVGGEVTIGGSGFRRGLSFAIGGKTLEPLSITPTSAVFRLPASIGAGPTNVTIDGGLKLPLLITTSDASISGITPPCSAINGGSLATITGSNFTSASTVQFGSVVSTDTIFQNGTLVTRVPPSFGVLRPVITVFNANGSTATLTNAFTYNGDADGGCGRHRAAR